MVDKAKVVLANNDESNTTQKVDQNKQNTTVFHHTSKVARTKLVEP